MPWIAEGRGADNRSIRLDSYSPQEQARTFGPRDFLHACEIIRLAPNRFPLHLLHTEVEIASKSGGLPWSDSISTWIGSRREEVTHVSEPLGTMLVEGDFLVLRNEKSGESSYVGHAYTFLVLSVTPEVLSVDIAWKPALAELPNQAVRLLRGSPLSNFDVFFEIRTYEGAHSWIRDRFARAQINVRRGTQTARVETEGRVGFLVVKALLKLGTPSQVFQSDPSRLSRLDRLTSEYWHHSNRILDLELTPKNTVSNPVIFIHGTASCGLVPTSEFDRSQLPSPPKWFRFEHDTFQSIESNAKELATKINQLFGAKRVLLVGHSRGGLVARAASAMLPNREVHTWTFGTPHLGTPLIKAVEGSRVVISGTTRTLLSLLLKSTLGIKFIPDWGIGLLMRLGGRIVSGIPVPDVQTAAWSYFLVDSELPIGFKEMAEDSPWLRAAELFHSLVEYTPTPNGWSRGNHFLKMFGGEFDGQRSHRQGYAIQIGAAAAMFPNDANDLVVSTASSTLRQMQTVVPDTTHFDYFRDRSIQNAIIGF